MNLNYPLVRERLEAENLTLVGVCRQTGLRYPRVIRGLLGGYDVRLSRSEIETLATALEISPSRLVTHQDAAASA